MAPSNKFVLDLQVKNLHLFRHIGTRGSGLFNRDGMSVTRAKPPGTSYVSLKQPNRCRRSISTNDQRSQPRQVSRKILPGYAFIKTGVKGITLNSPWIVRGRVTVTSTMLLFQMVKAQHGSSRVDFRRKLTRAQLEEKSAHWHVLWPN